MTDGAACGPGHRLGLEDESLAAHLDLELRLADARVGPAAHALLREQLQLAARVRVYQPPAAVAYDVILQAERPCLTLR